MSQSFARRGLPVRRTLLDGECRKCTPEHPGPLWNSVAAQRCFAPGDILLLRTGASGIAVSDPGGYVLRAWGLTKEAGEWVRQQGVKTIGIDCVTIESADTAARASVHTNLLRPAALGLEPTDVIAVIENLVGIEKIPDHRFSFAGFPLPLAGAAGSPLRAVALPEMAGRL